MLAAAIVNNDSFPVFVVYGRVANPCKYVLSMMRRNTVVHINSMDDSGDLEEAYERLGAVFHHDCYVDKKPEGRLFVCIAKNRSLQCNLGISQVAISMLSSCVLLNAIT